MITRRTLLQGLSSAALLLQTGVGFGKENDQVLKLYSLADYVDPSKESLQFQSINPKTIPGIVVYKVWTTWCDPCLEEVSGYNELHRRYEPKIQFLSVLNQHSVDQQPPPVIEEPKEFRLQCIEQGIRSRYSIVGDVSSDLVSQIIRQTHEGKANSPVAQEVAQECERILNNPPKKGYSFTPEDRQALGQAFNELRMKGKVPVFPTYVLDHYATKQFLQVSDSVPYTAIFVDGNFQGGESGSRDTSAVTLKPRLEALLK